MKLNEIVGFNAGMWVSPMGQIISVTNTHIDDIIMYPDKFGVTSDYIKDVYKRFGERVGQEGEAREEIILYVLTRGWIRVRRYKNYWSITLNTLSNSTKKIVRNFVHTLVKAGNMSENDDIRILEIKGDNLKTLEASDILSNSLDEAAKTLPFVGYGKVASMINESSLSRIHSKMSNHACGSITAFRGEFTYAENKARNRVLLAKLQSAGYQVTSIIGTYVENYGSADEHEANEQSFFVVNKDEGDDKGKLEGFLVSLGQAFDQDSILSIPFNGQAKLVGTSKRENAYPDFGQSEPVGKFKGGKAAQFMSKVNGRAFAFEDLEIPSTNNGKQGMMILASKDWRELLTD